MKHLTKLLSLFAIASLVIFMSCGGNDSDPDPDDNGPAEDPPAKEAAEALAGTWNVTSGSVTNNGETRSEWEEAGFSVSFSISDQDTFMNGTFSTSNVPDFDGFERIWPASGTWAFEGTPDNPNTGTVTRDDGIEMSVSSDGSSATITFTVPEEGASVPGSWSFSFTK